MTTFSRKKIRGFDRKLKQLEDWKNYIISFPTDNFNNISGQIFRINLRPFYWYSDMNPSIKFHRHLYKAYADILRKLKDNENIRKNKLKVQLWLFYPRTIRSLVIVASHEQCQKRNERINVMETNLNPPRLFGNSFDIYQLKIGSDKTFELIDNKGENAKWLTHRKGDIWVVE